MACTLVHFFNLQHPGNAARGDFSLSQQRSSIGLTFASLATTLFSFILDLVGASKALAAARQAVSRFNRTIEATMMSRTTVVPLQAVNLTTLGTKDWPGES